MARGRSSIPTAAMTPPTAAMSKGLHWVVGNEPIALNQLKERYYDPGLLAKYMGFKKEPLRDVAAFKEVKLYPEVKLAAPTAEKPVAGNRADQPRRRDWAGRGEDQRQGADGRCAGAEG